MDLGGFTPCTVGYFMGLSFLLAWALEGEVARPDMGDLFGSGMALVGVFLIMFWPGRCLLLFYVSSSSLIHRVKLENELRILPINQTIDRSHKLMHCILV
jgi:hypothetical protein